MDFEPAAQSIPEQQKEVLDDNARKFVVEPLDPTFLQEHEATVFLLVTDWIEMGKDNETKVVYKKFSDGIVEIFLISKVVVDGKRTKEKEKISEEKYNELLGSSKRHIEKMRHEFNFTQGETSFVMNYDEFAGGKLSMLDVDAKTEEEKNSFDPNEFPSKDYPIKLIDVSEDRQYSGYRVADIV